MPLFKQIDIINFTVNTMNNKLSREIKLYSAYMNEWWINLNLQEHPCLFSK